MRLTVQSRSGGQDGSPTAMPKNLEPCPAQASHRERLAARNGRCFNCCNRTRADMRSLSLMPPQHQCAGNVDARIGARDNSYQECEGEVIYRATAKNIQRKRRQKDSA